MDCLDIRILQAIKGVKYGGDCGTIKYKLNKFFLDNLEDYCNGCIYKDVCCKAYKIVCFNVPQERLDYLASMIYGKPTKVLKEGDTPQCS